MRAPNAAGASRGTIGVGAGLLVHRTVSPALQRCAWTERGSQQGAVLSVWTAILYGWWEVQCYHYIIIRFTLQYNASAA